MLDIRIPVQSLLPIMSRNDGFNFSLNLKEDLQFTYGEVGGNLQLLWISTFGLVKRTAQNWFRR
jgi:hypothetical protein